MTSAEFIAKTYDTTSDRERRCSSVFTDYSGTVYSYGYHYPLAFKVAGLDFVNTAGYSSTTSKHICWARGIVPNQLHVKLWRDESQVISASYSTPEQKLESIKVALERELASVQKQMGTKTRHETQVYRALVNEEDTICSTLNKVYGEQLTLKRGW